MMMQLPLTEEVKQELLSLGFSEHKARKQEKGRECRYTVATSNRYFRASTQYKRLKQLSIDDLHTCLLLDLIDKDLQYHYLKER